MKNFKFYSQVKFVEKFFSYFFFCASIKLLTRFSKIVGKQKISWKNEPPYRPHLSNRIDFPFYDCFFLQSEGISYIHISPDSDVFYTGIDHLRIQTNTACLAYGFKYTVVIDASKFTQFDYTSVSIVKTLARELDEKNVILILQYMDEDFKKVLEGIENLTFCDDIIPLGYLLTQRSRSNDHLQIKL